MSLLTELFSGHFSRPGIWPILAIAPDPLADDQIHGTGGGRAASRDGSAPPRAAWPPPWARSSVVYAGVSS